MMMTKLLARCLWCADSSLSHQGNAIQRRGYKKPAWKNYHKIQNMDLIEEMTQNDYDSELKLKEKAKLVYVCGLGIYGALGLKKYYQPELNIDEINNKNLAGTPKPQRLREFPPDAKIRDVACGYGFTIIAASVENISHTAFGFGLNNSSQIGYHQSKPRHPLEVVASPSPIHIPTTSPITRVACGRSHSILVDQENQVYTLGNNSLGQCGRKIQEGEEYFGSRVVTCLNDDLPRNVAQVTCGQDHSFFLTEEGQLYSCGWGADGQTGLGHYNIQDKPKLVKGDINKEQIIKVSSAADTVLALNQKGDLFAWGNSEYAQFRKLLGIKDHQFNEPRHVKLPNISGKIVDIAAGGTMCSVLTDSGHVYVWGFGILGMGPKVDHLDRPSKVAETLFGHNEFCRDVIVKKIYASLSHFAAINNQGELFMWGKNRFGCLGFSHGKDQYFPWRVNLSPSSVLKVALGVDHTCILLTKML